MVLAMKYAQAVVGFPTTLGPSNAPLAKVIDGVEPLSSLNTKRLTDGTFERGLQDPSTLLKKLTRRVNTGVFQPVGTVHGYNQCAFDFVKNLQVDMAYFDPPYPDTLDYTKYHYHLNAMLQQAWPEKKSPPNPFTKSVDAFLDLLSQSQHIPVWICSYGNKAIPPEDFQKKIQEVAPKRVVFLDAWDVTHMPHVSKSTTNQEVLIIAVDRKQFEGRA